MKFVKAISAAAVITAPLIAPNFAEAGRLLSLKHNVGVSRNDGNPRLVISDGSRLKVFFADENRNPLRGAGHGYQKIYRLDNGQTSIGAEFLHHGQNCVDTLNIGGSYKVNNTYEQAMHKSC